MFVLGRGRSLAGTMLLILQAILAGAAPTSVEGAAPNPATYQLEISRLPLEEALLEFARQSGTQILFFSRITEGLSAPALSGRYTMADAMTRLLANSGLTFRILNPRTVEVRQAAPPDSTHARHSDSFAAMLDILTFMKTTRSDLGNSTHTSGGFVCAVALLSFARVVNTWAMTPAVETPAERRAHFATTERKAYAGDSNAEHEIGDLYCIGYGVKVNLKQAAWWYKSAARHGNVEAQQQIAEFYEFGYGVQSDHAKALEWIHKAMAKDPQSALGIAYHYGIGQRMSVREGCSRSEQVPSDPVKAMEWYRVGADAGEARSQTLLGEMLRDDGGTQELEEALRLLRAAAQTDSRAMGDLARAYQTGTGVPQDFSEAAQWYSKAVEKSGYTMDLYELGLLYEKGLGVGQDREKAMELYFAAAVHSEKARSRLFSLYEANLDLPADPHQVIAWYETAAAAGNRLALVGLGIRYRLGAGVTPNPGVACALYLQIQQSPTDQQDFAGYVVSMKDPYCGGDVPGLAKEMRKPGNLLNAIREYLARPRQDFLE